MSDEKKDVTQASEPENLREAAQLTQRGTDAEARAREDEAMRELMSVVVVERSAHGFATRGMREPTIEEVRAWLARHEAGGAS